MENLWKREKLHHSSPVECLKTLTLQRLYEQESLMLQWLTWQPLQMQASPVLLPSDHTVVAHHQSTKDQNKFI